MIPAELGLPERHPLTGEPFVDAQIESDTPTRVQRFLPPSPPDREVVTEWDDDGPTAWRTLSDEEFAAAQSAYEGAHAHWKATGGMVVVKEGPTTSKATLTTASGAVAIAVALEAGPWKIIEARKP